MAVVLLEAFDAPEPDLAEAPGPSEDWLDGHAAGVAAAQSSAAADAARQAGELARSLAELEVMVADVRSEMLAGLAPLFEAVLTRILPPLVDRALVDHGLALLQGAAGDALNPAMALAVHPDHLSTMSAAMEAQAAPAVDLVADDTLGRGEVVLTRRAGETAIDLGRLQSELTDLLSILAKPGPAKEDRRHG